ncbi:hypothetical protein SCLCIDRAFT_1209277, partial [Scleroderma citrinum Foug A]
MSRIRCHLPKAYTSPAVVIVPSECCSTAKLSEGWEKPKSPRQHVQSETKSPIVNFNDLNIIPKKEVNEMSITYQRTR